MKTLTIGRSSSCDIILEDNSISRVHAEISVVGGKYVFKDVSKNGSTLNGEYINNRSIQVTPGAPIMLANRVPLPWAQIYAQLPLKGVRPNSQETKAVSSYSRETRLDSSYTPVSSDDTPSVGLNILSFFIPLVGWIMYFSMKQKTPERAAACCQWAWIGFGANLLITLLSSL